LALRDVPQGKPYEDLRYEQLTGGLQNRQLLYLMRRWLNFSPGEVESMPWHERQMYEEGIGWEASGFEAHETYEFDDLGSMGITVRKV
jgi:hypothetical protein